MPARRVRRSPSVKTRPSQIETPIDLDIEHLAYLYERNGVTYRAWCDCRDDLFVEYRPNEKSDGATDRKISTDKRLRELRATYEEANRAYMAHEHRVKALQSMLANGDL